MALSHVELQLVNKLRNRVDDVVPTEKLQDDHFLVRWLRARDLDIERAEQMLRKSMEWRKRNEIDAILEFPPSMNSNYRFGVAGHDVEGCPVFIIPIGLWNAHEMKETEKDQTFRLFLWMIARVEEEIEKSSIRLRRPVTQAVIIADYQQLAYLRSLNNRHLVKLGLTIGGLFEANFPERLKRFIFVNTARMFPIILRLGKPFLSSKMISKFEVYGPQRNKWIAALEHKVPMEILPPYYGGTRTGSDDFCSDDTSLWNGETLPSNYYRINIDGTPRKCSKNVDLDVQIENDFSTEGGSTISEVIEAGSRLDLQMIVSLEMCSSSTQTLNWWIKSEGYDIGMKVAFRADGQNATKDIVDFRRVDAHLTPQNGLLVCEAPGVYILVLDNSYSKRRKKVVSYRVYLTKSGIVN